MNENKKVYALLGQYVEFNKVDTVWVAVIPDRTMIAMEVEKRATGATH